MTSPSNDEASRRAHLQAERRKRLAEVFGDVMPDTTSDEREPDTTGEAERGDTWLRDQVPPHHGG